MNKKIILSIIFILIIFICLFIAFKPSINIELSEDNSGLKIYDSIDSQRILTDNISSIKINGKELKDYLKNNSLDHLFKKLNETDELNDGGTKIYSTDKYTIIKCNKKILNKDEYNKDIIITKPYNTFNNFYCSNHINTFTKTYLVKNIKMSPAYGTYNLTIEDSNSKTYKVLFSDDNNIVNTSSKVINNNIYNFEFHLLDSVNDSDIVDTPNFLFEAAEVVSITLGDKDNYINEAVN